MKVRTTSKQSEKKPVAMLRDDKLYFNTSGTVGFGSVRVALISECGVVHLNGTATLEELVEASRNDGSVIVYYPGDTIEITF